MVDPQAERMMEPMLAACPSFRPVWTAFAAEDTEPELYVSLGRFAQHLADLLAADQTERFEDIFAGIEDWFQDSDAFVADAAAWRFLEHLQESSLPTGSTDAFRPYLGPNSRRVWDMLNERWGPAAVRGRA